MHRLATVMEPPACLLHLWLGEGGGLVSHVSVIGDRYAPFSIFDGQKWLRDAAPPADFHPPDSAYRRQGQQDAEKRAGCAKRSRCEAAPDGRTRGVLSVR